MTHSYHPEGIRKTDLRLLNYAEFGQFLGTLTENVLAVCREHRIRIDAVAPILRSGAFTGCHLASKLKVVDIVPLQYKHTHDSARPIDRRYRPLKPTWDLADNATVLVADTNTVTGEIARLAAADIRAIWPNSTIVFASVMLDVSLEFLPEADVLIFARRINERRTLSSHEAARLGVSNEVYVFPWEDMEEQWAEIQAGQPADNRAA
jgi:hypoxanthine phosphoribosyltransferase